GRDSFSSSFGNWFDEERRREIDTFHVRRTLYDGKPCSRHASSLNERLSQPLVKRERHHKRVGKRTGDAIDVKDRRHLCLAGDATESLGNIEDKVPLVALGQAGDELLGMADTIGGVPQLNQRRFDVLYRVGTVEFGSLFFAESRGEVFLPQ